MFFVKLLTGFSSLGTVALIPWSLASKELEINFKFAGTGGAETSQTLVQILKAKGEEGYKGCVALEGGERKGRLSYLYVCIKPELTNKSFLFHYDNTPKNLSDKLNEVTQINLQYSWKAEVQLKNGSKKTLWYPPFWMGKFKNTQFKPAEHCQMTEKNKTNYTLVCSTNKDSSKPELTQVISESK